ncbi:hypothetical protein SAMN05421863_10292 [Nitrosomonas communis]|uniref:Uncharacterized protein n=1 Tax=Nitrosomonas communis TaxID=44574 RepID=A0A1I4QWR6_9PROT|nr:hypothetical protein SAMN05421863_10292 [Nitrosomonas communis]
MPSRMPLGQTGFNKVNNPVPMRDDRVSKSLESWNAGLIDFIASLGKKSVCPGFIWHVPQIIEQYFEAVGLPQSRIEANHAS